MKPGDRIGTATVRSVTPVRFTGTRTPRPEPVPEEAQVTDMGDHVCFTMFVETKTFSNLRGRWTHHNLATKQKEITKQFLEGYPECLRRSLAAGCTVRLTRIASRKLDANNLADAFKAVVDQLGVWLWGGKPGQRDDNPAAEWHFAQIVAAGANPAVVVSIERRPPTRGG